MINWLRLHSKENFRRIVVLIVFFIFAYFTHNLLSNFEQELTSAILILVVFSGVLVYEYKSLFKKNLPRAEYFFIISFIILFTVLLFATIYSYGISNGNNYFIENGKNVDLTFSESFYFSVVTLTTVGYGDIVPLGVFRYFAIIEIFMGLIYIGTMIFILTKNLDRK